MRKLLVLVPVLALAACGGKSSSSNNGPVPLTGTVGGRAFTNPDVRAIPAGTGSTACRIPLNPADPTNLTSIGVKAMRASRIATYAGTCGDFGGQCKLHQNSQSVANPPRAPEPGSARRRAPLAPGTYTVYSSLQTAVPDPSTGLLDAGFALAMAVDAAYVPTTASSVQGGTVRLDQVTGPITGHIAVTFQDGGALTGDFSAPLCTGLNLNVCDLAAQRGFCTLPPTPVPSP